MQVHIPYLYLGESSSKAFWMVGFELVSTIKRTRGANSYACNCFLLPEKKNLEGEPFISPKKKLCAVCDSATNLVHIANDSKA